MKRGKGHFGGGCRGGGTHLNHVGTQGVTLTEVSGRCGHAASNRMPTWALDALIRPGRRHKGRQNILAERAWRLEPTHRVPVPYEAIRPDTHGYDMSREPVKIYGRTGNDLMRRFGRIDVHVQPVCLQGYRRMRRTWRVDP